MRKKVYSQSVVNELDFEWATGMDLAVDGVLVCFSGASLGEEKALALALGLAEG